MTTRKTVQAAIVGLLVLVSLSASEPTMSQTLTCPEGYKRECRTSCQYGKEFGSHIPVCVFRVTACWCKKTRSTGDSIGGF